MYLFVFIFVIMSVLGLYTELFSLRMAQIMAQQKTVAETMMQWHAAAFRLIKDNETDINIPANGCSLTEAPFCTLISSGASLSLPATAAGAYLPVGYAADTEVQFDTLVYTSGTTRHLVTYVTAGDTRLGFTTAQIYQQMKNARLSQMSYGYVATQTCAGGSAGTWLMTTAYITSPSLYQICYPIPLNAGVPVVPVGSVGVHTSF